MIALVEKITRAANVELAKIVEGSTRVVTVVVVVVDGGRNDPFLPPPIAVDAVACVRQRHNEILKKQGYGFDTTRFAILFYSELESVK